MEPSDSQELRAAAPEDLELVRDTLQAVARPRMTGTAGAEEVAAQLRGRLQVLGYEVREMRFRFSALPGRFGIPLIGAMFLVFVLGAVSLLRQGRGPAALINLSTLLALCTVFIATFPTTIRRLRWGGLDGVNWLVHRGGSKPRYLVCAHRDSKSQFLPTYFRGIA